MNLWVLTILAAAESPSELAISLKQAAEEALSRSPRIVATGQEVSAAEERSRSYFGVILPKLSLEGSWRYTDPIPEMAFGPGPAQPFGDHYGRSLDGVLTWTLWDNSAGYRAWRSSKAAVRERDAGARLARRQVLLSVRSAYAQLQLALEQVRLLSEGLVLAQSQYKDIQNRLKAGASSRLDALSAHQVVLSRTHQLRDARLLLASALRDLLQLMARPEDPDLSVVVPAGTQAPPEAGEASLSLSLDPLETDLATLSRPGPSKPDLAHPSIQSLRENASMRGEAAKGLRYSRGPRLVAGGRLGRDYPNGPVLETVDLKAASLALSFPVFEGGRTLHEAREQDDLGRASSARADGTTAQVVTEWRKARDNFEGRRLIRDQDLQAAGETEELAGLVYEAYKAGRKSFLEVESANLRALEARVQAARTGAQMFLDAAQLAYYSEGDE